MAYVIRLSPEAVDHLRAMAAGDRAKVTTAIETTLTHEPLRESRNRKPLRPNPLAPWELRVGALRVYYRVLDDGQATVVIAAIGRKRRERVVIGGEEFRL